MDHFSKYKLQENASDDEGEQQQQKVQQLPLQIGSNTASAKVGEHYLEIIVKINLIGPTGKDNIDRATTS